MQKPLDYIVNSDGWLAGKMRKKGDPISMTPTAAKYENVTLKSEVKAKEQPVAPKGDPKVKPVEVAKPDTTETAKSKTRKK